MLSAQRVRAPDPLAEEDLPREQQGFPPGDELDALFNEVDGNAAAQIEAEVGREALPPRVAQGPPDHRRLRRIEMERFVRDLREAPAAVQRHRLVAVGVIVRCWRGSRRRMLEFVLGLHVYWTRKRVLCGTLIVEWARCCLDRRAGYDAVEPRDMESRWSEVWPSPFPAYPPADACIHPAGTACIHNGVETADLVAELRSVRLSEMVFSFAPMRSYAWGCATTYDYWKQVTRVLFSCHAAAIELESVGIRVVAHNAAAVSWIVKIVLEGYVGSPIYDLPVHFTRNCRERVDYLCGRRVYSAGHALSWRRSTDDTTGAIPQVPPLTPAYEVVIDEYCMSLTPRMREGLLLIYRLYEGGRGSDGCMVYRGALPSRFSCEELGFCTDWRTRTFSIELPLIGMRPHGHCHRWGDPPLWKRHRAARHLTQWVRRKMLIEVSSAIIETAIMDVNPEMGRMPAGRFVDVQSAMIIDRELHMGCALTIYDAVMSEQGEGSATLASVHSARSGGARFGPGVTGDPHDYVLYLPQIGLELRGHNPAATKFLFAWAAQWYARDTWKPTRYDYVYVSNLRGYTSSGNALRVKYYPRSALYETDRVTIKWNRRHPTYVSDRPGARSPTRGYVGDGAGPSSEGARTGVVEEEGPLTQSERYRLSEIRPSWTFHETLTEEQRRAVRELLARYAHLFALAEASVSAPPSSTEYTPPPGWGDRCLPCGQDPGEPASVVPDPAPAPPVGVIESESLVEEPNEVTPPQASEGDTVAEAECTCPYWCAQHDRPLACSDVQWEPGGGRYFRGPFVGRGKPRDSGRIDACGYMIAVDGAAELIAQGHAHKVIMALHHSVRPGPFHYHYRRGCLVCQISTPVAEAIVEFATWYMDPNRKISQLLFSRAAADQSTAAEGEDVVEDDEMIELMEPGGESSSEFAIQMRHAIQLSALEHTDREVSRSTSAVGSNTTPRTGIRTADEEDERRLYGRRVLRALHHSVRPGPYQWTYVGGGQLVWDLHQWVVPAVIEFATWYLHLDRRGAEIVLPQLEVGQSTTASGEDVVKDKEAVGSNVSWQAAHAAESNLALSEEERGRIQKHADDPEAQEAWACRDRDGDTKEEDVRASAAARDLSIANMLRDGLITLRPPRAEATVGDELQLRPPRVITVEEDELELRWELNRRAGHVPSDLLHVVEPNRY